MIETPYNPYLAAGQDYFEDHKAKCIGELAASLVTSPALAMNIEWRKAQYGVAESPIEEAMCMGFVHAAIPSKRIRLIRNHDANDFIAGPSYDAGQAVQVHIHRQYPVVRRRLDFAIEVFARGERAVVLAVECDGKDFHSTDEQLAADRRRDAELLRFGIHTIRFTGSELHADPQQCAETALRRARELFDEQRAAA